MIAVEVVERFEKALKEERDRVAALDRALADALLLQQGMAATIVRLNKEGAMACLQLLDRAFVGTVEEGIADLIRGKTDPAVVQLVMHYQGFPLDVCTRCARPAPVSPDDVCAWGCPP